jgi:uncharacterized membrane protein YpjA
LKISYFWSKPFLASRPFLWLLLLCNFFGTIYGYIWYESQLALTWRTQPWWQIVFVPDSPTASLFFTISIAFLLFLQPASRNSIFVKIIEALAVVTSIKYGIWAVSMILGGAYQGMSLQPTDFMLIFSHLAMAVEALLYIKLFKFRTAALIGAVAWTLLNDFIDYTYEVYPWLPETLNDDVPAVMIFTIGLTLASGLVSWMVMYKSRKSISNL